jgi:hypothetical protein
MRFAFQYNKRKYLYHFQSNRAEFDLLKRLTFDLVALASDPFVSASIMSPAVAKLPIFKSRLGRFVEMFRELNEFVDANIEKQAKTLDDTREPSNFIEAYLLEKERLDASGKPHNFS